MKPNELVEVKKAMSILLEANPNCSSEYLFKQIMDAYAALEKLVKESK